jgi:hypothetical protein
MANKVEYGSSGTVGQSKTPDVIHAEGDVWTRLAVVIFVTIIVSILALGGIIAWLKDPTTAKDLWVIIGPIISGAVLGVIGFIAGERRGASKKS